MPLTAAIPGPGVAGAIERAIFVAATAVVLIFAMVGVSGYLIFARAASDAIQNADAVIVLGGEHDGREEYGLQLARRVSARAVVLSDPYPRDDAVMRKACSRRTKIEILCRTPVPQTTRGEALLMRTLAHQRHWGRVVVVTWRYHIVRTRLIFEQCYSQDPEAFAIHAVPSHDELPSALWEYTFLYQYAALLKATLQGNCQLDN